MAKLYRFRDCPGRHWGNKIHGWIVDMLYRSVFGHPSFRWLAVAASCRTADLCTGRRAANNQKLSVFARRRVCRFGPLPAAFLGCWLMHPWPPLISQGSHNNGNGGLSGCFCVVPKDARSRRVLNQ